ncbi:MAG: hypothetical protein ABI051_01890 [Vicinamibacterales bacterium]
MNSPFSLPLARRLIMLAGLLVCLGDGFSAAQDPLPSAREIIARHVAALGGEAAYRVVRTVHARGRLEIPAQKVSGDLELFSARPNKLLYRVTVGGIGVIETGFNGVAAWSVNPIVGPELLTGTQLSEAADDAWFDGTLHLSDHVREMTTVGRETFDGRPAYKVHVVFRSGNEQNEYFDIETGLQSGAEAPRTTPSGVVPTVNVFRNYRRFGLVLQATTLVQRALGFEQVVTITSCDYEPIPDSTFDPPPQVKALQSR